MAVIILLMGGVFGCTTPSTPPPQRDFTTTDLLITPSQMPMGWTSIDGPEEGSAYDLGFRDNLGGGVIELTNSATSIDHMVALFPDARAAARAYRDHDYSRNTSGRYPETWYEIKEFNYASPLADQYRVVCAEIEGVQKLGDLCVIEVQYEEFLSVVIYNNTNPGQTVADLETIAKSVDERMAESLEK
jgi:hypothetical protein